MLRPARQGTLRRRDAVHAALSRRWRPARPGPTRAGRLIGRQLPIAGSGRPGGSCFRELARPALKPLPSEPYVFAEWRVRWVGIEYHVEVEGRFYSVPYRFARSEVEVRLTARTVENFVKGERIAAHMRGSANGKHTTAADHMPSSHRQLDEGGGGEMLRRDLGIAALLVAGRLSVGCKASFDIVEHSGK